jgi:sulfur-oxidizing protein SoxX
MSICKKICQYIFWGSLALLTFAHAQTITPPSVQAGFEIMYHSSQGNCVTCHVIGTEKSANMRMEKQGNFGPALTGIGSKYTRAQITQWVTDARKINPQTLMPPYGSLEGIEKPNDMKTILSAEQIQSVVDALLTLKSP